MTEATEIKDRKRKHIPISDDEDDDISILSNESEAEDEIGRPPSRDIRDVDETEQTAPQDRGQAGSPAALSGLDSASAKGGESSKQKTKESEVKDKKFYVRPKPIYQWAFTAFQYEDHEKGLERRLNLYAAKRPTCYIVYGYEICPTTKKPHLQGFAYCKGGIAKSVIDSMCGGSADFVKTTAENCIKYCKKPETKDPSKPVPFIELNAEHAPQDPAQMGGHGHSGAALGKEAEMQRWHDIKEMCKNKTFYEVYEDHPDICIKYKNAITQFCKHFETQKIQKGWDEDFLEDTMDIEWTKPFQSFVLNHIEANLEKWQPRKICWIAEAHGGIGKTTFAHHLRITYKDKVQIMEPADYNNMAYLLDPTKKIFIIDCQMTKKKDEMYPMLEALKNGCVQSVKYECHQKWIRRPIVIVFSNQVPDLGMMSAGRYELFDTENPPTL